MLYITDKQWWKGLTDHQLKKVVTFIEDNISVFREESSAYEFDFNEGRLQDFLKSDIIIEDYVLDIYRLREYDGNIKDDCLYCHECASNVYDCIEQHIEETHYEELLR